MPIRALAALLLGLFFSNPSSAEWKREWLVPGGPFRGIHGLVVGPDGMLYVGSVMGQTIHRVDPATGRAELVVAAPDGMADDLVFAPDGTLYFTGFMHGTLSARSSDGTVRVLARDLPGMNSLALDARGRLFATQVFAGDALYEFDREGKKMFIAQMESMMDRYRIFMKRFELSEDFMAQMTVEQLKTQLNQFGITPQQMFEQMNSTLERMKSELEKQS